MPIRTNKKDRVKSGPIDFEIARYLNKIEENRIIRILQEKDDAKARKFYAFAKRQ